MKKKRIAFVTNGLYGGGAEKVLQTVLRYFNRERYDITVISYKDEVLNELYPADLKYKSILKSPQKNSLLWTKIFNKINLIIYERFSPRIYRWFYLRERFDVEIAFIEGYATRIVSGGRSLKKVAWVHTDLKNNPWTDIAFHSRLEQSECYSRFDCIVSVSDNTRESFDNLFLSKQSITIYNPLDSNEIRNMSSSLDVKKEETSTLFISAGRLVAPKGYDRLIPIVGRLVSEGFNIKLWIVGEGSDRPLLEKLIREWKLEGVVKLLGFQSNPYPFFTSADWFVCSSRAEGYSLVVAEAQILGIPVIATRCAGIEEHLGNNNEWGILVENDDESLLEGMKKVLKELTLTEKYREKSIERGGRFSLKRQMDEIYSIIEG